MTARGRDTVTEEASDERELRGNTPLVLAPGSAAWEVRAGRVQVFAVLGDDRQRRLPLFTLGPEDVAFPLSSAADDGTRLLLVALEEGTLVRPASKGDRKAMTRAERSELRYALEAWLDRLAETVAEPSPATGSTLPSSGKATLESGAAVWPAARTAWVRSSAGPGVLLLFGDRPLGDGEDLIVPVPAQAWVHAAEPTTIEVVGGASALASDAAWHGVEAMEQAVLDRLRHRADEQRKADADALENRFRHDTELRQQLYGRLAGVVDPARASVPTTGVGGVPAPLVLVAEAAGIELRAPERPTDATGLGLVDVITRASGVRWRRIVLEGRWWRKDLGPLVAFRAGNGRAVALVARRPGAYHLVDPSEGTRQRVDAEVAATLEEAVMLYRPLPAAALSGRDMLRFVARSARRDLPRLSAMGVLLGAMSLITPLVTNTVFNRVVPQRESAMVLWFVALLVVFAIGAFAFGVVAQIALARISGSGTSELQAAMWDRVLDLPLPFFRRFTAGALASRVMAIEQIQQLATVVVATSVLALPVGLFNLVLAFWLSARLALFGTAVIAAMIVLVIVITRRQLRHVVEATKASQESYGVAMELIDGIGKLRVADAEDRALAQWGERFTSLKEAWTAGGRCFAAITTFTGAGTAVGTLALFLAVASQPGRLSGATFLAFNIAFGQALAAAVGLAGVATFVAEAKARYDSARPVLETAREVDEAVKTDPGELTGAVEVSHVTFRYAPDDPPVLDDVTFSIEPLQFVAIVGPSGSGKSSLLRILLGFEQPEVGSVRYDGKDLDSLDLRAVRRQIGVVTQSVRLLPGDIFTNIVGTRQLTMDDAWEAAEMAGIADDIRAMPMQMHTFVAEGASTFSGGQRQRLLIARAVAAKPRLLLFDEATSALDNRTQARVAAAVANLRSARIVIAHRLSTIQSADRILVLRAGRLVQAGTYDELMAESGDFARLARRQLV
jgi:NHLM bacteriocin system ABC transporter ATP-binding protein